VTRPLIGTDWQLTGLLDGDELDPSPALRAREATLRLDPDGRVSGSTGCNRFAGNYAYLPRTLTFGPLAVTRMACLDDLDDQERHVLRVLVGEVEVTVDDEVLVLTTADGAGLVYRAGG
jgi:heat shock protein HslJ